MEDAIVGLTTVEYAGHIHEIQEPPATIRNLRGLQCGDVVVGEYLGRGRHGPRWLARCAEGHAMVMRFDRLHDKTSCMRCLTLAAMEKAKHRRATKKLRLAKPPSPPPPVVKPRKPLAPMPPGTVYVLRDFLSGLYRAEWRGRMSLTKQPRKAIRYPTVKKATEASMAPANATTRWNVEPLLLQRPAFSAIKKPTRRRSGCTGKVRHRSEGAAASAAAFMTLWRGGSGVYNCDFCGGWHTTSKLRLLRTRPFVAEAVQG